jgi:hypothetical protein
LDETQTLAVLALRRLLDDPARNDWDELLAASRALIKAIAKGRPIMRRNIRIVAEAGWRECARWPARSTSLIAFIRVFWGQVEFDAAPILA